MVLDEYVVEHKDGRTETLMLSGADASRYRAEGARVTSTSQPAGKAAPKPANKARSARNKSK